MKIHKLIQEKMLLQKLGNDLWEDEVLEQVVEQEFCRHRVVSRGKEIQEGYEDIIYRCDQCGKEL